MYGMAKYIDTLDKLHTIYTKGEREDDWKSIVASSYHLLFISQLSYSLLIYFHSCCPHYMSLTYIYHRPDDILGIFSFTPCVSKLCVKKIARRSINFMCGRKDDDDDDDDKECEKSIA